MQTHRQHRVGQRSEAETIDASTDRDEFLDDVRPKRDAGGLRWLVVENRVTMRRP